MKLFMSSASLNVLLLLPMLFPVGDEEGELTRFRETV
jgi:hypothetical protein